MKVLLVYPLAKQGRSSLRRGAWIPLGLSFIASSLREAGHSVSIFDRYAAQAVHGGGKEAINSVMLERVKEFNPDLIGFNTVSPLIYDTAECVRLVRRGYGGLMVAGGHHASALPELTLERMPELSGVVEGEGEEAMVKLAGGVDPLCVPGVWWRSDDGIKGGGTEQIKNLDLLPFPDLGLLDMDFYRRPGRKIIRGHYLTGVSILTSRGCARKCSFCTESLTYGGGVRFHSPGYALEWIRRTLKDFPAEGIYFHDNDFLTDTERAAEICEGIAAIKIPRRVKFAIQTRADRVEKGMLGLLKKTGCVLIELGVESAAQEELDWMGKGSAVEINERAISLCRQAGVGVHAYMMSRLKGETIEDLDRKLEWLKKAAPDTFSMNNLNILPGTLMYLNEGMRFFEDSSWSEENVKAYFRKDFLSSVPEKERREWMKKRYAPWQKRVRRRSILKFNSPSMLGSMLKDAVLSRLERIKTQVFFGS